MYEVQQYKHVTNTFKANILVTGVYYINIINNESGVVNYSNGNID